MDTRIIAIVGESGSGKTTIAERLEKDLGYRNINSFTTRKKRYENEPGHIFTTKKQYEANKAQGTIVAKTFFDNEYYWTTEGQFYGECVYVVDVAGIKDLKQRMKDAEIVVIYLKSETNIRMERMHFRKYNIKTLRQKIQIRREKLRDILTWDEDILQRLDHDKEAFGVVPCDYCIDADRSIKEVLEDVKNVITDAMTAS